MKCLLFQYNICAWLIEASGTNYVSEINYGFLLIHSVNMEVLLGEFLILYNAFYQNTFP